MISFRPAALWTALLGWVTLDVGATPAWRTFLMVPYRKGDQVDYAALNAAFGTTFRGVTDIFVPLAQQAET